LVGIKLKTIPSKKTTGGETFEVAANSRPSQELELRSRRVGSGDEDPVHSLGLVSLTESDRGDRATEAGMA